MTLVVVPAYAAIFTLMLVFLSLRVANTRREMRVSIGDGGHLILQRRIRAQGNFIEYVPIALLLLAFLELQSWPHWLLQALCLTLLAARIVHAYGIGREPESIPFRATGMATTALLLVAMALLLLYGTIR